MLHPVSGGKGVATAAGGLCVLMPAVAAISAAIWVAVFFTTRYVSLASILAALALPVLAVLLGRGHLAECVAALIALFVFVRHRANIGRLLCGTEKRFERRKPGRSSRHDRPEDDQHRPVRPGNGRPGRVEAFARLRSELEARLGARIVLRRAAVRNLRRVRGVRVPASKLTANAMEVATDPQIQIVCELMGGTGIARR